MSRLIVIAGPTGVGKTETAIELGLRRGGELINYDSVQIYRGFDIGSAKPDSACRERIRHHLLDVADAAKPFDVADFVALASRVCERLLAVGTAPILVGGTGFYLRALLGELPDLPGRDDVLRERIQAIWKRERGPLWLFRMLSRVDPETAAKVSPRDRHRIERALEVWLQGGKPISAWNRPAKSAVRYDAIKFALTLPRVELVRRLDERVDRMFEQGLLEETRRLLETVPREVRPFQTIGYKEAVAHVLGEIDLAEAKAETQRRTRAYAKRQMTWLRGEPDVIWIDASGGTTDVVDRIEAAM